jgi:FdhE protein
MPYVATPRATPRERLGRAEQRWSALLALRPDLAPAVDLQRRLITFMLDMGQAMMGAQVPRPSLTPDQLNAKLRRGVPALAGEAVAVPTALLKEPLLALCTHLAQGGAGAAAEHIRSAIEHGAIDSASLLEASVARDEAAIRCGAIQRDLAPDLLWLAAELAVSPYVHTLVQALFEDCSPDPSLRAALDAWDRGYCPACGSWPALAEVVEGHRILRCSFCAAGWELNAYACIYCGEAGEPFVTAAPDEERKDRRVEVCGTCAGYLKTIDLTELSPFPLLAIGDLETTDLDVAAMERGYRRPPLRTIER